MAVGTHLSQLNRAELVELGKGSAPRLPKEACERARATPMLSMLRAFGRGG